jgi:predicted DNA-binding protein with PD1-like motif
MFAAGIRGGGSLTFSTTGFGYVLILEPGDELLRCLIRFAREQELDSAFVSATGTVSEVEIGSGAADAQRTTLKESLDAGSLTGTLTLVDGEPFPQLRGSFVRADHTVAEGHIYQAVCADRLEISLQPMDAASETAASQSIRTRAAT